ncbi:MAG: hypothetical protein C4K60_20000 [Ideonella sp. MAG2]|nr:MAG: hypothetical protein C4K60_20000 [Ideonella sp. MAG2]
MDVSTPPKPTPPDAIAGIRERIAAQTGLLSAAIVVPFGVLHYMQARYNLAAMDLVAAVVFGSNSWMIMVHGRPMLPYPTLVAALAMALLGSVYFIGNVALHWVFPAVLFFYMMLGRRQAHASCIALMLAAAGFSYLHSRDIAICARFVASVSLTILLLNVVLSLLGELQQRLIDQSLTDPLTGALNRRGLDDGLQELARSAEGGQQAVLLSFDIDHFKRINDELGHAVGDEVLRQVVRVAREGLRAHDRLYRVGGEEFVLALCNISTDQALRVAEDLRQRIAAAKLLPERPVTVSIGLCAWQRGLSTDRWLGTVDAAMYEAKHCGRNRVVVSAA